MDPGVMLRALVFCDVQQRLRRLREMVCPLCEMGEPMFCGVVDGLHSHVGGDCAASPIRQLQTHVDDLRDQFASEFNPQQKPRARWRCEPVLEGKENDGETSNGK